MIGVFEVDEEVILELGHGACLIGYIVDIDTVGVALKLSQESDVFGGVAKGDLVAVPWTSVIVMRAAY